MSTSVTNNIEAVRHWRNSVKLSLRTASVIFFFAFIGFFFIEAGVDFENYDRFFDLLRTYDFSDVFSTRVEPLFGISAFSLTHLFTGNFAIYFFFLVLSVSLKAYIISSARLTGALFALLVGFYLFRYFPLYELTQIRASLAMGFVMLAFHMHGARFKWALFLSAVLFHYSAIVLLPLLVIADAAQTCKRKYIVHERLIWFSILSAFAIMGLMSRTILENITPYFSVLQIYDVIGFGETTVDPLSPAIFLDILGIVSALALQRHMSASTRFWIYIQVLGVFSFYSLIELPILAFRIREMFGLFWIFYIRDALEYHGVVKLHALLFVLSCMLAYFYFYFLGKSAIFPISL